MLDTHAIARQLVAGGVEPPHADAITDAVRLAAECNDADPVTKTDIDPRGFVTKDHLDSCDFVTKADLAAFEARLYKFLLVQGLAIIGLTVGITRLL